MATAFFSTVINDLEKESAATGHGLLRIHQGSKEKADCKELQKDFPRLTEGAQKPEADEMQCRQLQSDAPGEPSPVALGWLLLLSHEALAL